MQVPMPLMHLFFFGSMFQWENSLYCGVCFSIIGFSQTNQISAKGKCRSIFQTASMEVMVTELGIRKGKRLLTL